MGICLGMQMLFDKSYEFGETEGLGLIPGPVELMHPANDLVIPHIGWNSLEKNEPCKLLESVNDGDYVYFVHSYAAVTDSKNVAAYCDYGMKVPALVMSGNVYGCQFHPEKSGKTGLGSCLRRRNPSLTGVLRRSTASLSETVILALCRHYKTSMPRSWSSRNPKRGTLHWRWSCSRKAA